MKYAVTVQCRACRRDFSIPTVFIVLLYFIGGLRTDSGIYFFQNWCAPSFRPARSQTGYRPLDLAQYCLLGSGRDSGELPIISTATTRMQLMNHGRIQLIAGIWAA